MKYWILIALCTVSTTLWAKPLTQAEFKAQVRQYYDSLEVKLAQLNESVDRRDHPSLMIAKACEYASGLKQLKQLAQNHQYLSAAQDELEFVNQLDQGFDRSLQDLGTTYAASCIAKK